MTDIRRQWIFREYDPDQSYNLDNPEIQDQSMGQAEHIRKIFKDKVILKYCVIIILLI